MNYYIIITARTASTLLCRYLKQLGLSYPQAIAGDRIMKSDQHSIVGLKANIEARRKNGYCGVKVAWGNINWIEKNIEKDICVYSLLYDMLKDPRFIYLYRQDTVPQAISIVKHAKTGSFHISNESYQERYREKELKLVEQPTPAQQIITQISELWKQKEAWELFFERYKIQPLRIDFEDIIANPKEVLSDISLFLGKHISLADMELEEQDKSVRTSINHKWQADIMTEWTDFF